MVRKQPIIEFKNVSKIYSGNKRALKGINLRIYPGDFVCLIGTSGGGKTTTLRMINKMITPTSGQLLINGHDVTQLDGVNLRRHIGYVIQNIGLIPHMTVEDNIALVPRLLGWDKEQRNAQAAKLIKLVDIPASYLGRYPDELSGGQQQRIGVVRALAANQQIILMDEPFGALDPLTRESLQAIAKRLQEEMGKTIVMITHDMNEALTLATRLVIMHNGKIIQNASPEEVVEHPANQFVRELIGEDRINEARAFIATASNVMDRNIVAITAGKTVKEAVAIMKANQIGTLLVNDDNNQLRGILHFHQVYKHYQDNKIVADLMDKDPQTVYDTDRLSTIVGPLLKQDFNFVPVIDHQNHLKGVITQNVLIKVLYDHVWGDKASQLQVGSLPAKEGGQQ